MALEINDVRVWTIQALCHVPASPAEGAVVTSAQVALNARLDIFSDHLLLSVVDPLLGSVNCQTIELPKHESDAEVLRRVASDLDGHLTTRYVDD